MANQTPTQVVLKSDAAKRKFEEVLVRKQMVLLEASLVW